MNNQKRGFLYYITALNWPRQIISLGLIGAWLLVLIGVPPQLPVQPASWLTFIALLITPGYFLADIIAWRLDLDWLEQLALALSLGIAILAVPGTVVLLRHLTITELTVGWTIMIDLIVITWLLHSIWVRLPNQLFSPAAIARRAQRKPWAMDEIIMLLLLAGVFVAILPTLNLSKIDGDAYAVGSFAADALAGLPLNATEPIFGTNLGPGVRMIFNQSLTMSYLWSHLAGIDSITLTSTASRSMLALWAMLATYTLGKAAGRGSRRFGLFLVFVQMLIYLAAPFLRGDNVSLFFFERINADKFMVPVTMLPVIFAFAMRFMRDGRRDTWLVAAMATFAVSIIHPLIAAMLALALATFGGFHFLLSLRSRIAWKRNLILWLREVVGGQSAYLDREALRRTLALWALVLIVMVLPMIQLVLARGEAPLAESYPSSFAGWPLGEKMVPAFPFYQVRGLDLYGPLPDLAQIEASQANTTTNPFLIWRFGVNMNRRRLILFSLNQYISDPNIILEPPYLLALLMLPLLFWRIRSNIAAQFAVSTTLAVLFVMFNPIITPFLGSLVMPWILWRFIWLMPYALIIALPIYQLLITLAKILTRWFKLDRIRSSPPPVRGQGTWGAATVVGDALRGSRPTNLPPVGGRGGLLWEQTFSGLMMLGFVAVVSLAFWPSIDRNIHKLNNREVSPFFYPTPDRILTYLSEATADTGSVIVLADQDLSVTIPAYVANANVVAHRVPTTSEVFPATEQDIALQRLIDQDTFYRTPYLTAELVEILHRYNVRYVIVSGGTDLDLQLRLASQWFTWQLDDQSYSLYTVHQLPVVTTSIQGNTALAQHQWVEAEQLFQAALAQQPDDLLALIGLAEVARAHGQFDEALTLLHQAAIRVGLPGLHYQLGQLYAELGQGERSIAEFDLAQRLAPRLSRYHVALGDACLSLDQETCTATQYLAAVVNEELPDDTSRLIAQADLWRLQERMDRALPLYEQAVALRPSEYNQFVLEGAYREAGRYNQAEALVQTLGLEHPLSSEIAALTADVMAAQNRFDEAITLYRYAIWLQEIEAQETTTTRIALARTLLAADRLSEAANEIEEILRLQPYNAFGYRLQGDLYRAQGQFEQAITAYERAFQLDPTQIAAYVALSDQLRQYDSRPDAILELLQTALRVNPDEATLFLALGDQLQARGEIQDAIGAYQLALNRFEAYALSPQPRLRSNGQSRAFTYARLARAYEDLGQSEVAMNYYQAVVSAAPEVPWTHVMLGDALRVRNELTAADASYNRAIALDPSYTPAYIGLAELSIEQTNYDRAETILQQAVGTDNQDETTYIRLGDLAGSRGNPEQALAWYRQAASLAPNDPSPNLALIDSLLRFGGYDTALTYIQAALDRQADSSELRLQLGRVQRIMGRYVEAETTLLEAKRMGLTDSRLYSELTALYLAQGQPQTALELYQEAIDRHPEEASNYLAASQILSAQGHFEQALAVLKDGLTQVSQPAALYVAMSNLHLGHGEPEAALEVLEQGLLDLGRNAQLLSALGTYYASRAEFELAEQQFNQLLALQPDAAATHIAQADLYLRRGQTEEALSQYQQAVTLEPTNAGYYLALGDTYRQAERIDEAISAYVQALVVEPTLTDAYINLADLYQEQTRWDDARAVYEQGLTVVPTSGELLVQYGTFLLERGEEDRGWALLDRAVQIAPTVTTLLARAGLYSSLGRLDQAEQDLQLARLQAPASVDVLIALGDLYRERNDVEGARQLYQEAVSLMPGLPIGYLRLGVLANEQGDQTTAQSYADAARAAEPGALLRLDDGQ
jgi:tetratricopeptide (TPR) repeat protein